MPHKMVARTMDPYLRNHLKKSKIPLKRSMSDYEVEYMVLDNEGYVVPRGDDIINNVRRKYPKISIVREIGKHMIEIRSFPSVKIKDTALNLLNNFEKVAEEAKRLDLVIYPYATYPGKFKAQLHMDDERYCVVVKTLGSENYDTVISLCTGFHYHYTLPKGVFDHKTRFLKPLIQSKVKQTLIDSYNMMIAMDPAITTLMQSSPFVNGRHIAKDSRMLLWRGGKKLKYNKGAYSQLQSLGGLQPYKQTIMDLIQSLENKDKIWKRRLKKAGFGQEVIRDKQMLDCIWCPVKVNKVGTLEQRGMDVNKLKYVIAMSALLKYVLRAIHQDYLHVMPSDIGIEEPFRLEGNVIYIPPHSYVRNKLQYLSAYNGFDSKEMYRYCKRFLTLAKTLMDKSYLPIIKPLITRFNQRQTVSDVLIKRFKRRGYGKEDELPNDFAAEMALKSSQHFIKEIEPIRKTLEDL